MSLEPRTRADLAMAALHQFYLPATGLWATTGWWNAANILKTTIDYCTITHLSTYQATIANTFKKHRRRKFLNRFYDDQGWWALAWIAAYDLTHQPCYLEMAEILFADMQQGWDDTCGGGLWWTKERTYKNAITTELFLSIAAQLHLRLELHMQSSPYLDWALRSWNWLQQSGLINGDGLINDGLDCHCQNNQHPTWTYNQGVILGGLVDLYHSTGDRSLLIQAQTIATATLRHLAPHGILQEPCEPDCGADGPQFKGIFIRNLSTLYHTTQQAAYHRFILHNAQAIWSHCRSADHQFGLCWNDRFDRADAARQSAAIDVLNAALRIEVQAL